MSIPEISDAAHALNVPPENVADGDGAIMRGRPEAWASLV
jgi:hypothetical protein